MPTIKQRLESYGFSQSQIIRLINNGKLDTCHGLYELSKSGILKLNGIIKQY